MAQAVHEIQADALKTTGRQKETKVGEPVEPLLPVFLEEFNNQGPRCAVLVQQSQPLARVVQVTFGQLVEADGVVVADGEGGEVELLAPVHVEAGVGREGQQVEEPVGRPGDEEPQRAYS